MEDRFKITVGKDGKGITAAAFFSGVAECVGTSVFSGLLDIDAVVFYFCQLFFTGENKFSPFTEFKMKTLCIPVGK